MDGLVHECDNSPFSICRLMLDHPPLNTVWKGKVMLVHWEMLVHWLMQAWHGILVRKIQELQEIRRKNTGHFSKKIQETYKEILMINTRRKNFFYNNWYGLHLPYSHSLLPFIKKILLNHLALFSLKFIIKSYNNIIHVMEVPEKSSKKIAREAFRVKIQEFLSPPVHIARWAHMHRFLSVRPSVRLSHF